MALKATRGAAIWLVLFGLAGCSSTEASDDSPREWRTEVEPFLWLVGITGDFSTGDGSPGVSLDEPLALEGGALLQGGVSRGEWGLAASGLYVDYGGSTRDLGGLTTQVGIEAAVFELAVERRIESWEFDEFITGLSLDALGGLRYSAMDLSIETQGLGASRASKDWVDPLVGGRVEASFGEAFSAMFEGDVGGFGISSDFVWSATLRVDWKPNRGFGVFLGYSLLDYDFEEGGGSSTLRYDLRISGPLIGVTLGF